MKVLMSAFACSPIRGSEPGVGWNWAREMSKYNEVWVLTRESNRIEIENNIQNENIKFIYVSIPIIKFMEKYTGKKIIHIYYRLWQRYVTNYVKNINDKEKFDIIHHVTYNEFRNPGYLWKLGSAFILGPIGGSQDIEKELFEYCEGRENKIIELIRSKINIKRKKSNYFREAINNSSKVIVANSDTARFLELPKEKSEVILETGIRKENLNYIKRKEKAKIRILWVGNLIYRKGLRLLIEAFNKIDDKDKYEVIIIGEGTLKEKYMKLINNEGINDYFTFYGKLSYEQTLKEYKNADIFIFTSLRDTSGNVVLEAMANCLPVISLNHHGAKDMLSEQCGIKIDINSSTQVVNQLQEAIEYLGNNHNIRLKMGIEGYERIKKMYLWNNKGKYMQQIYEDIVKKRDDINE